MSEKSIRDKLKRIDEKRARADLLAQIADWPWSIPSEMRADKKRGWFASIWRGDGDTVMGEIVLTREERAEIRNWMLDRSLRLAREANELSATLEGNE